MHPANVGVKIESKLELEAAKKAFGDVQDELVAGEIMNVLGRFMISQRSTRKEKNEN